MDQFFSEDSVATVGSLYNMKELYGHTAVKKKVMDDFQHVWDLLKVCICHFKYYGANVTTNLK